MDLFCSTNRLSNPSRGIFDQQACRWPSLSEILTNRSNKSWQRVDYFGNAGFKYIKPRYRINARSASWYSERCSNTGVDGTLAESRWWEPPRQLLRKEANCPIHGTVSVRHRPNSVSLKISCNMNIETTVADCHIRILLSKTIRDYLHRAGWSSKDPYRQWRLSFSPSLGATRLICQYLAVRLPFTADNL